MGSRLCSGIEMVLDVSDFGFRRFRICGLAERRHEYDASWATARPPLARSYGGVLLWPMDRAVPACLFVCLCLCFSVCVCVCLSVGC